MKTLIVIPIGKHNRPVEFLMWRSNDPLNDRSTGVIAVGAQVPHDRSKKIIGHDKSGKVLRRVTVEDLKATG